MILFSVQKWNILLPKIHKLRFDRLAAPPGERELNEAAIDGAIAFELNF